MSIFGQFRSPVMSSRLQMTSLVNGGSANEGILFYFCPISQSGDINNPFLSSVKQKPNTSLSLIFLDWFQRWVFPPRAVAEELKVSVRPAERDADRTLVTSSLRSHSAKHSNETHNRKEGLVNEGNEGEQTLINIRRWGFFLQYMRTSFYTVSKQFYIK